jgi:hypothetical protein
LVAELSPNFQKRIKVVVDCMIYVLFLVGQKEEEISSGVP